HRMRVVYRGEHRQPRTDVPAHARRMDVPVHVLSGPLDLLVQAAPRRGAGFDWATLAAAMTRCPLGRTEAGRIELRIDGHGAAGSARAARETLYTWIIAPRGSLTARA